MSMSMSMSLLPLALAWTTWGGCSGADPDLRAQARSLEAWEEGRAALEAGDAASARDRFHAAHEAWPSPLLGAWEARALASTGQVGDLEAAVARLEQVLRAKPRFAEARYNRAAYMLRLEAIAPAPGRIEQAAAELQQALADGEDLAPRAVLQDPDFASVLRHPAFAFLPREALSLAVHPPPDTAFWGAEVPLRIRLLGIVDPHPPVAVSADRAVGPLELVTVVEDTVDTAEGQALEITWTWRVIGAGPAVIGPLTVRAGGDTATADVVTVQASAPPDRTAPARTLSLAIPSELISALEPRAPAIVDGALAVRGRPSDRVEVEPQASPGGGPPVRYERREAGVPVDVVWRWPSATPARVRIRDGSGAEVFSGAPLGN
jgi:hypothetical protein